ncbi:RxLR effector protein [Phytophthora megakarya]|uniref:RxLR effector protein n=1 Tax=Phytophthora megakarya TaxID=4795 RepID=A0A225UH82_9STRA|nr:RxLR effector protein [Phytophthora megakarya]
MRLLLFALLATWIIFLSSCEAAAPSDKLSSTATVNGDFKRLLRVESNKIVDVDNEEERGFAQSASLKLKQVLSQIKATYLKWEMKVLAPSFEKKAAEGITVSQLKQEYVTRMMNSGWWTTPPGFKRYIRKYQEWLIDHPRYENLNDVLLKAS